MTPVELISEYWQWYILIGAGILFNSYVHSKSFDLPTMFGATMGSVVWPLMVISLLFDRLRTK